MSAICYGCDKQISNSLYMVCRQCSKTYDIGCLNIKSVTFATLSQEQKKTWICPSCINTKPKPNDVDSPIRTLNSPVSISHETYVNQVRGNRAQRDKSSPSTSVEPDYVTQSALRTILRQEMRTAIKELVMKELSNINQQISSFHDSMTFINSCFEDLKKDIDAKTTQIKALEEENGNLKTSMNELTKRLDQVELHMRDSNVEINGIPEKRSENLVGVLTNLSKSINYDLASGDILHTTRIAKSDKDTSRPRSVIVKLRSARHRDGLLAAVATYNKKNPKNKLSSTHLGMDGPSSPIYVSEHFTPLNKSIHAAARKKGKELKYQFVWVRNGRVYMRKNAESQAIQIRSHDGLKMLV